MSMYTADQKVAMNALMTMFGMWGEGKFKGVLPYDEFKANCETIFAPDAEADNRGPSAPVFNKVYRLDDDTTGVHAYMAFWDTFEFIDLEVKFHPGPVGSNQAYMAHTNTLKRGSAQMVDDGMFVVTVNEVGKITLMKNLWGNVKAFDDTFGTYLTLADNIVPAASKDIPIEEAFTVAPKKKKGCCCAK